MVRLTTLPTASGSVDLPCFFSNAITPSVGDGCFLASIAVSVSMGFPPSEPSASRTLCCSVDSVIERVMALALSGFMLLFETESVCMATVESAGAFFAVPHAATVQASASPSARGMHRATTAEDESGIVINPFGGVY